MSNRLNNAAAYLEGLMNEQSDSDSAEEEDLSALRSIISALRSTSRTDLDHSVWASVFSVLGINKQVGDFALVVSNILEADEAPEWRLQL